MTIYNLDVLFFSRFPCGSADKEFTCNVGDFGLIPGLGRSPGEGEGFLFQYSALENSMDCIVHGVTKSWTQLSNFQFHLWLKKTLNIKLVNHTLISRKSAKNWSLKKHQDYHLSPDRAQDTILWSVYHIFFSLLGSLLFALDHFSSLFSKLVTSSFSFLFINASLFYLPKENEWPM